MGNHFDFCLFPQYTERRGIKRYEKKIKNLESQVDKLEAKVKKLKEDYDVLLETAAEA